VVDPIKTSEVLETSEVFNIPRPFACLSFAQELRVTGCPGEQLETADGLEWIDGALEKP